MRPALAAALLALGLAGPAPAQTAMPVAEARSATNNSAVLLEGRVTGVVGADSYRLGDATGEIEVRVLPGLVADTVLAIDTRLRVTGRLRQRPFGPRVDAASVEVLGRP